MEPIQLHDFDEFFAAMNGGHKPFSWQCALVSHVVQHGVWPDQIVAPTGAGKSSVVDVHIFLNALSACGNAPRIPRRLHTVVNRRGLVDNQYQRALSIQANLIEALRNPDSASDVVLRVASALQKLSGNPQGQPFVASVLRGGLTSRSLPVSDFSSCAVIASTPDMWGSRALFQGYGSTLYARPRETALMTMDSVVVLDEAHLNRQLLVTARRIRDIQQAGAKTGIPELQVVETTATPSTHSTEYSSIGVDPNDLEFPRDDALHQRLHATKRITHEQLPQWNGKMGNRAVIDGAVERIEHWINNEARTGTIGCIMNHVDTAIKISAALKKAKVRAVLLVGRLRPHDLEGIEKKYPGIFTPQGHPDVDVVVATQTLEVGVDVDFQYMVTELAPATAVQQRIGRLNRLGKYDDAELVILQPTEDAAPKRDCPPYTAEDLRNGLAWINQFEDGEDINPARVGEYAAPATDPRRLLYQRLEFRDVELLAKSSERHAHPMELEFWLRDDLSDETPQAGVVVRHTVAQTAEATIELLRTIPPTADEVFPGSITTVREVASKVAEALGPDPTIPQLVYRAGEIEVLEEVKDLKPGDVLIVTADIPITTEQVLSVPAGDKRTPEEAGIDGVTVYLPKDQGELDLELFRAAHELTPAEFTELWYSRFPDDEAQAPSIEISTSIVEDPRGDMAAWIIRRESKILRADSETIQEWTPRVQPGGKVPPTLADHQRDVAQRAREICDGLGVESSFAQHIITAAELHDEGKRDPRFQRMLKNPDVTHPWAKSLTRSRQEILRSKAGSGLPVGWRHEQLSAVIAEEKRLSGDERINKLVVHIVGASHGRGRDLFPQTAEELAPGSETAHRLFTEGQWESNVRTLTRKFGAYTLALCESLERAADAQISGEGR